jgi:hypothetical protein
LLLFLPSINLHSREFTFLFTMIVMVPRGSNQLIHIIRAQGLPVAKTCGLVQCQRQCSVNTVVGQRVYTFYFRSYVMNVTSFFRLVEVFSMSYTETVCLQNIVFGT